MINLAISLSVLALVVAALVGAASIIWLRHMLEQDSRLATMESSCERLSQTLQKQQAQLTSATRTAPADLADRVDALAGELAKCRDIQRRFAGRFDQYMGAQREREAADETPEATRARLRAEHGLPKMGNHS